MLRSMTGFGRSRYENEGREYIVEIKSVNNRYSDITIKLPRNISFLEEKVKTLISNSISRGKIDVFITFINNSEKGKKIKLDGEGLLAQAIAHEIDHLDGILFVDKIIPGTLEYVTPDENKGGKTNA